MSWEVVYLASDPARGKLNRPSAIWAGPALLGVFALLTLGFGGWMYCSCHRAAEDRQWLLANGEQITGKICGVLENRSVGDRGYRNTTYRLVARTTDFPELSQIKFESHGIDGEPAMDLVGRTVKILVDPNDPSRYHMDVRQLA